jgi:hypothetical protein
MFTGLLAGVIVALVFYGPIIGGVNAIFDAGRNIQTVIQWEKAKKAKAEEIIRRKACANHTVAKSEHLCGVKAK